MKKNCLGSFVVSLVTAVLFICCLNETKADNIAFAPTSLSLIPGEPAGNDGLFFTPTVKISITALGYIDCGFSVGHPVGLYDVTTSLLLGSTTVTGSSTLTSNFRYNLITPIILTAGHQYAIVGTFTPGTGPDRGYQAVTTGAATQITYQGYEYDTSSTLNLPTTSYPSPIFGPDFQYVIPVPEPATTGCFLIGLGVLAYSKRSRI